MKSGSQICWILFASSLPGWAHRSSHARSAFTIHRLKIGRECRRDLGVRAIRNGQLFEKDVEREVFLFEKRDMLFEEHAQVMARPLRQGLLAIAAKRLFGSFQKRSARREEHARDNAADDGAVKTFVVREIGEHWIGATSGKSELDRTFAEPFFQLIEVEIEQGARFTDNNHRLGIHAATCLDPEIFGVV